MNNNKIIHYLFLDHDGTLVKRTLPELIDSSLVIIVVMREICVSNDKHNNVCFVLMILSTIGARMQEYKHKSCSIRSIIHPLERAIVVNSN